MDLSATVITYAWVTECNVLTYTTIVDTSKLWSPC